MTTYKFKTNIKCSGCLTKVMYHFNKEGHIKKWDVDIHSPDKLLLVDADVLLPADIINILARVGFTAEHIS